MNIRRMLAILAAVPLAVLPAAAFGQTETVQDSSAEAQALEVEGVITISGTSADTSEGGSAEAAPLKLGDETVIGGSQEGEGSNSGSLVATPESEDGHLHVAPWEANVDGEGNASSRAAVVDGNLGGEEGISVVVLESRSDATNSGSSAESTGARVVLGGNQFEILHAQTASDGNGEAYLVNLAGEKIGTDEDFGGQCVIPADPLVTVVCVRADEIAGENLPEGAESGGEAFIADVSALDDNLQSDLIGGSASQTPEGDVTVSAAPAPEGDPDPAQGPGEDRDALPRTGAGLGVLALGLAALGSGEGLRRWKRS